VIAVALSYNPGAGATTAADSKAPPPEPDDWRLVARYARGRDYHDVMRPRLERIAEFLSEAGGARVQSRAAVDTSAVLERDLAARAGLGWIGKNTNLLDETLGSYVFLGVVLTTAELAFDTPVPDRCGTCTACLDACPTRAFVAPYVLDARRCISYLTIEHRGDIDEALRESLRDWAFGCDVWKARPTREPAFAPSGAFAPIVSLLALDAAAFRERFRGSAITRAKRAGLVRNAALVLGNRGDPAAAPARRASTGDHDVTVRHAAAWALARTDATERSTNDIEGRGRTG
jgi:epoxyqueuosine reductase